MTSFMENNTHNRNLNNFPINSPKKCPKIWVSKPLCNDIYPQAIQRRYSIYDFFDPEPPSKTFKCDDIIIRGVAATCEELKRNKVDELDDDTLTVSCAIEQIAPFNVTCIDWKHQEKKRLPKRT
eukprot:958695_1